MTFFLNFSFLLVLYNCVFFFFFCGLCLVLVHFLFSPDFTPVFVCVQSHISLLDGTVCVVVYVQVSRLLLLP